MGLLEALTNMSTLAMIVFIVGMILVAVEMFIPGFGVAGGFGILLLFVGVILTAKTVAQGLVLSAVILVILAVLLAILLRSATRGRLSRTLILKDRTDAASGFSGTDDLRTLVGHTGTALTVLRPSGSADFNGVRLDVVTRGEFIEPGTPLEVIEVEGNRIVVRETAKAYV
ncbi:MAG: NfeD family protein [Clostridiaceae bacterium]|nr:NfeD family protein [Clostridiaceae bacterium]